jgi:hypothetical protein
MMSAQRDAGMMADGGDAMRARVAEGPEVETKITLAEVGIDISQTARASNVRGLGNRRMAFLSVGMPTQFSDKFERFLFGGEHHA